MRVPDSQTRLSRRTSYAQGESQRLRQLTSSSSHESGGQQRGKPRRRRGQCVPVCLLCCAVRSACSRPSSAWLACRLELVSQLASATALVQLQSARLGPCRVGLLCALGGQCAQVACTVLAQSAPAPWFLAAPAVALPAAAGGTVKPEPRTAGGAAARVVKRGVLAVCDARCRVIAACEVECRVSSSHTLWQSPSLSGRRALTFLMHSSAALLGSGQVQVSLNSCSVQRRVREHRVCSKPGQSAHLRHSSSASPSCLQCSPAAAILYSACSKQQACQPAA